MKHQKFVCLAGTYSYREEVIREKKKYITYIWRFEKIKTKKGCDSYFEDKNCQYDS